MKIEELYFGIKNYDPNTGVLETRNLFSSSRILRSVALYVSEYKSNSVTNNVYKIDNPLRFCFGDSWSRREYEYGVCESWNSYQFERYKKDKKWEIDAPVVKMDVYKMYVEPNEKILMDLVNSVDPEDAKKWLEEDNERRFGKSGSSETQE